MLSSDLKIGITFAIFNLEGNVPRLIDLLRSFVNTSLIISLGQNCRGLKWIAFGCPPFLVQSALLGWLGGLPAAKACDKV